MLRKRYCTLVRFKTPQTSLLGGHRHQINLVWPRETESSTAVWNTTLWPFTLLTWVFTGSVFTSIPPADTVLGATPPNSTEPYRTKTSELDFHPKVKYKEQIHVTNWSNSSVFHCTIILYIRHITCWYLTHTHTQADISNTRVSDWPCWRGSVCRCPSAVGCGTPSPRCGPGASSSGWW